MAKKRQSKKDLSTAQKVGIGVGLTAAAVAAAGTYFLYGSKDAPKNRKKVKSWALKAKADVLEALEKAEHITEEEYHALVDAVSGAYGKAKNATASEVKEFQKEMKGNWGKIQKSGVMKTVSSVAKKARKPSRKTSKKPSRKTTKKTTRKATKRTTKKTS